jgi:phage tail sheath protein FI
MPEYLYPGVYVEEIDTGNKPIEGVSTSTVGFLGIAERGPTSPTLITSFGDYQRAFGRYVKDGEADRYLAYAVEGFFQNGGERCFVQRVFHSNAKRARGVAGGMTIWAVGPGLAGNNIAYQVSDAGLQDGNLFKLTVAYWQSGAPNPTLDPTTNDFATPPTQVEVFDDLSFDPKASTFYESEINDVSDLIVVKQTGAGRPGNNGNVANPNVQVGSVAGLANLTPLAAGGTLTLTLGAGAGAPTVTFTQGAPAAGPIKTVADLITAIGADAVVGAKASLDASGHLTIADPGNRGNLAVAGTLAAAGAGNVGVVSGVTPRINNAGPPVALDSGTDGINPDLQVGAVAGLTGVFALAVGGTLILTAGGAPATFTQGAPAAAPIINVNDLIAAIAADPIVGATAALDATGHLTITDPLNRGNLKVGGTLAAAGAGNLGVFAAAASGQLALADFDGADTDPSLPTPLQQGSSQTKIGLRGLGDVDEISLLCCPDEFYPGLPDFSVAGLLQAQCERMKDRFAILQTKQNAGKPETNSPHNVSKYAALYYPWLKITNPISSVPLLVPSGGHMAGIYARSDARVGVHKDPANELIEGITELQLQTNDQQQAILNPKGVNVLRYFKGAGNLVWGGRTTSNDPDWKYINVRRLFIFIEKSILRGTQWVVFENNDEPLWARVRRSIGDFLTVLWRDGMLQGAKKEQAYFVRCDRTTMTQADIDNGRLICVIGIAPVKPAEFVIFRIGQWDGGSSVSEG